MKILINASNIHTGGGKTLLDSFLNSSRENKNINFVLFVDQRYNPQIKSSNIQYNFIKKHQRFFLSSNIKKKYILFRKL